jgi:predicted pyridoxine 5'-phosphate oxidase superfamily flavin-nucleotide-binding protein
MAMAPQAALVEDFLKSRLPELLRHDVFLQGLSRTDGREGVIGHLNESAYHNLTWGPAEASEQRIRVVGKSPAGSQTAGLILLFEVADGQIAAIWQQPLFGGAPMAAAPVRLTDQIKALVDNALATRHPIAVAYVDETGQPILSFRGSTQTFSDDQLAIWVRNSDGKFLRSLEKTPKVALMYRDEDTKATYQFQGRARVSTDEADRQRIYDKMAQAERNHDPAKLGVALIIDLDRVEGWAGMGPNGQIGRVRMIRN